MLEDSGIQQDLEKNGELYIMQGLSLRAELQRHHKTSYVSLEYSIQIPYFNITLAFQNQFSTIATISLNRDDFGL